MARTGTDWRGLTSLFILILLSGALSYFFVWRNIALIDSAGAFWGLVFVLIFISFVLSAVEAGFSSAPNNQKIAGEIATQLADKAQRVFEADSEVVKAGTDVSVSRAPRKAQAMAFNELKRLKRKETNLIGSGRVQVVGALSALNVVTNTALATFLPTFLAHLPPSEAGTWVFVPPEKMLIFVSAALPILYAGKIIPKIVGLQHSYTWGYKAYWIGNATNRLIGWVPRGLAYGLIQVRLMKRES